jgi:hypothetical protein
MENFEKDYSHESLALSIYPVKIPFLDSAKGKYEFNSFQKMALELTDSAVKDDLKKAILVWDIQTFVDEIREMSVGLSDAPRVS